MAYPKLIESLSINNLLEDLSKLVDKFKYIDSYYNTILSSVLLLSQNNSKKIENLAQISYLFSCQEMKERKYIQKHLKSMNGNYISIRQITHKKPLKIVITTNKLKK